MAAACGELAEPLFAAMRSAARTPYGLHYRMFHGRNVPRAKMLHVEHSRRRAAPDAMLKCSTWNNLGDDSCARKRALATLTLAGTATYRSANSNRLNEPKTPDNRQILITF
jgi:hypothetical protein